MNSESSQPPREELQAQLTAFLLGELSADEATAIRQALEQDAELAQLHDRLQRAIDLVREATTSLSAPTAAQPTPLKLSEERRQRLLQQFKTVVPKEFKAPIHRDWSWLAPMSIAAALVLVIGWLAITSGPWGRAKAKAQRVHTDLAAIIRRPDGEVVQQLMVSETATASSDKNGRALVRSAAQKDFPQAAPATEEKLAELESRQHADDALAAKKQEGDIASLGTAGRMNAPPPAPPNVSLTRIAIILPNTRDSVDAQGTSAAYGAVAASGPGATPGPIGGFGGGGLDGGGLGGGGLAFGRADGAALSRGDQPGGTRTIHLGVASHPAPTPGVSLPESEVAQRLQGQERSALALDSEKLKSETLVGDIDGFLHTWRDSAGKPVTAFPGEVNPVTGSPVAQTATPNNAPALRVTDGLAPLTESSVALNVEAVQAPALGDTPALGKSFEASDRKDTLIAGTTLNSTIALPQTTTPQATAEHFAWAAQLGSRSAGGDGKLGFQGGTAPSFGETPGQVERGPFGLKPVEPPASQNNLAQGVQNGIVASSISPQQITPQQQAGGVISFTVNDVALGEKAASAKDASGLGQTAPKNTDLYYENRNETLDPNLKRQLARIEPKAPINSLNGPQIFTAPQAQSAAGNTLGNSLTTQLPLRTTPLDALPASPPQAEEAGEKKTLANPVPAPGPAQLEEAKQRRSNEAAESTSPPAGLTPSPVPRLSEATKGAAPQDESRSYLFKMDPKLLQRYGLIRPGMLQPGDQPAEQAAKKLSQLDTASKAQNAEPERGASLRAPSNAPRSDARSKDMPDAKGVVPVRNADVSSSQKSRFDETDTNRDGDAKNSVFNTVEPQTARRIERDRNAAKSLQAQYETAYRELKHLPKDELRKALPKATSDRQLTALLDNLSKIESELKATLNERGADNPKVAQLSTVRTNLNAQIDARVEGGLTGLATLAAVQSNRVAVLEAEEKKLREKDAEPMEENRALAQAKRDLAVQQRIYETMKSRVLSESVDAASPKSSAVKIVSSTQSEAQKSPTLWERFRGTATRTARIEVAKEKTNVAPLLMGVPSQNSFDPYFIQTEFEKIKSKAVLYKVIEKLNLNEAWAKKHGGGQKLRTPEIYPVLLNSIDVRQLPNSSQFEIQVKNDNPNEAALIANTIAEVYRDSRAEKANEPAAQSNQLLAKQLAQQEKAIAQFKEKLERLQKESKSQQTDPVPAKPAAPASVPQPEVQTSENAFSTFSLNVADVSFKLAAASLEKGVLPEPATIRSEEFINAFDYRDSEPPPGAPIAFAWERARYPFAHNRDLLRFSVKTAAQGREAGRPLNLVLLLDNSGSMERADRVRIIREALRVLAAQLQPQDKLSVVSFARTARLWADGVTGNQAAQIAEQASNLTPQGGTNLEDAMNLGYETARRHYVAGGVNRVVLLTDGAANLGNVDPEALKQKVEAQRKQGFALDCFGIGWEGFNDDLLEVLSRNGDGRYGFVNTPEEAATQFAGQLAGALRVAASDVKVQVEFNPKRVTAYRQIGYAKHQLTKEQFRDNTVDAAELGAAESGNALYVAEVNPRGEGVLAVVRVRYKDPATGFYHELEWPVPYNGNAVALEQASPAIRLAATGSAFSEWLASSPYAGEVTADRLLAYLSGVPEAYGIDPRPKKLEWMIRQAKSIAGTAR